MLTFEETLAIEKEFVTAHKHHLCIVPMRYLEAVYHVPATGSLDELCFLVPVAKKPDNPLVEYKGVKIFYTISGPMLV